MIGTALKSYATRSGLKVASGVAYGALRGYAVAMSDGAGTKQLVISTRFSDPTQENALRAYLNEGNALKQYRVQNMTFTPQGIQILFTDTVGTMKCIEGFVDWFMPLLGQYGATGANICSECGMEITGEGLWALDSGVAACHVHEACGRKMQESAQTENDQVKEEATGSYVTGIIGALVGALLGAVLWAIIASAGYIVALAGLVIGILSNAGYNLLKGKQGKGKIAVLIVCVLVGVVVGTFAGCCLQFTDYLDAGLQWYHLPVLVIDTMMTVDTVFTAVIRDLVIGLLFAALGTYGVIARELKFLSGRKVKILK